MKAVVYTKYGTPDVLQLKDVDKPVPGEKEILIRVYASTVNRTDCAARKGVPFIARLFTGLFKPKSTTPGSEFAGEIVALGNNVTNYAPGDRVFGYNDRDFGAQAEFMIMAQDGFMAAIPTDLSYEEAAPCTEGIHYAHSFIRNAQVQKGQTILINGASGGIGSAALQLAKYYGAHVTAVCPTKNVELIQLLGADRVIDYLKDDFTQEDHLYDAVFDTVGKSSFRQCRSILKPRGIYISSELGFMSQNIFFALFTPLFGKRKVLFPVPLKEDENIQLFRKLMEEGQFKSVIDRVYPFDKVVEAYRYVETGQKTGNVVITNPD